MTLIKKMMINTEQLIQAFRKISGRKLMRHCVNRKVDCRENVSCQELY